MFLFFSFSFFRFRWDDSLSGEINSEKEFMNGVEMNVEELCNELNDGVNIYAVSVIKIIK